MSDNIVLLGYMGCGKSTIGASLAAQLQRVFIDLDVYIEEMQGMSISEIFENRGVIYFRKLERKALHEVLNKHTHTIIALGGGTPCYYDNMKAVNAGATSIYLQMNVTGLTNRLWAERQQRPLIAAIETIEELQEFIGKHLFERNAFYQQATHSLLVGDGSVEDTVRSIKELLA